MRIEQLEYGDSRNAELSPRFTILLPQAMLIGRPVRGSILGPKPRNIILTYRTRERKPTLMVGFALTRTCGLR